MPRKVIKVSKARFFFRRLTVWFIISLLLQTGVLIYLKYWYTDNGKAKEVIVSPATKKIKNKETYKFNSVGNITSYSVSYDARYVAFVDQESLKIYDIKNKKTIYNMAKDHEKAHEARTNAEINYPKGVNFKVSNLKWVPDRNKLFYVVEWENYKGSSVVNLDVYITEVNGANKTRVAHFVGQPKGTIMKNIALSTQTNLINLQMETPAKKSLLYQVDIMSSIKQLAGTNKEIGTIAITNKDGVLYAEIFNRKNYPPKISIIKDSSILDVFESENKYRILGVDNESKLYLGEESVTGIKSILTAVVTKETKTSIKIVDDPVTESKVQKTYSYTAVKTKDLNNVMDLTNTVQPDKISIFNDGMILIDNQPESNDVTIYRDGEEVKKVSVINGKKEILIYNKYLAVLKGSNNNNELTIYNLNAK